MSRADGVLRVVLTGRWFDMIERIRWGTPRPEWSGDTVTGECFVIELEETDRAILPE